MSDEAAQTGSKDFGWGGFGTQLALWIAFLALVVTSESTLGRIHDAVVDLPLIAELLVWLAFFPWLLALAVWENGWDEPLRIAVVIAFAVGWSIAFYPRGSSPRQAARAER